MDAKGGDIRDIPGPDYSDHKGWLIYGGRELITAVIKKHNLDRLKLSPILLSGYNSRCKAFPKHPKIEDELYGPVADLMNFIVASFPRIAGHKVVNTSNIVFNYELAANMRPDIQMRPEICILGCDHGEYISYHNVAAPIECKLNSERRPDRDPLQIGIYVQEIFYIQNNRRYVYSLIYTEDKFQLFHCDRRGGVYSDWVNYRGPRAEPDVFTKVILAICSIDKGLLGYQENVRWLDHPGGPRTITLRQKTIGQRTRNSRLVTYTIDDPSGKGKPFFHSRTIRGRGTVCWNVKLDGEEFVIKDMWRARNQAVEHELLERIVGLDGVGQLYAYEDKAISNIANV